MSSKSVTKWKAHSELQLIRAMVAEKNMNIELHKFDNMLHITNCWPAHLCQEKSRQYRAAQRQREDKEMAKKKQEQRGKVRTAVFLVAFYISQFLWFCSWPDVWENCLPQSLISYVHHLCQQDHMLSAAIQVREDRAAFINCSQQSSSLSVMSHVMYSVRMFHCASTALTLSSWFYVTVTDHFVGHATSRLCHRDSWGCLRPSFINFSRYTQCCCKTDMSIASVWPCHSDAQKLSLAATPQSASVSSLTY